MERPKEKRRCNACGRMAKGLSRGMCGKCYRAWQRDNFPPNAICQVCGKSYFRRRCASPKGRTCSRDCFRIWKVGRDQYNEPTDGSVLIIRKCEWCGREFTVEKRQIDKGFGRFCSLQCNGFHKISPRLNVKCEWCGHIFEYLPNRVFFANPRFCSRSCFLQALKAIKVAREPSRSRTYRKFRNKFIEQFDKCELCGSKDNLVLHHRVRSRERLDLLFAHDNLMVLCKACHTRHHAKSGHTSIPDLKK